MVNLFVISIVIIAFLAYVVEKRLSNPLTMFCILWGGICFLSNLRLFGMYNFNDHVYVIIMIGIAGMTLGYIFCKYSIGLRKKKIPSVSFSPENIQISYRKSLFFTLLYSCCIYYTVTMFRTLTLFKNGYTFNMIRSLYQGYADTGQGILVSRFELLFNGLIGQPFMFMLIIFLLVQAFSKKMERKIIIPSLYVISAYTIVTGARILILLVLVYLLVLFDIFSKFIQIKTKRKVLYSLCFIIVPLILLLSFFRATNHEINSSWGILNSFYAYFSIPVPLLDIYSKEIESRNIITYGFGAFKGIFDILSMFLNKIGIEFGSLYNLANETIASTETFLPIFSTHEYNAYTSIFFVFFMDFRELGVFIGLFFFGVISYFLYYNLNLNRNIFSLMLYLLFIQGLFKSFVRFEFTQMQYLISFIFVIVIFRIKEKQKVVEINDV